MELVYLWVEEYKNIKQQGFNFSPKFQCTYDYLSEKLVINKKKNYLNIFPNNIDVTAIIGENGSGKSSIVKLILFLIFLKRYESLEQTDLKNNSDEASIIHTLSNIYLNKNIFLLIQHNGNLKKMSLLYLLKECYRKTFPLSKIDDGKLIQQMKDCNLELEELKGHELNFFSIHFNYMIDTLYDGIQDNWIKNIYHRNDSYSTPLLLEPYKNANYEEKIDLNIIEYLNNQRTLKFYSTILSNKTVTTFFNPNKIKLLVSKVQGNKLMWEKKSKGKGKGNDYFEYFGEVYKLENKFRYLLRKYDIEISNDFIKNVIEQIRKLYKNKEFNKLNLLYIAFKVLSSNPNLFNKEIYERILLNFKRKTSTYNKKTYVDLLIEFNINELLTSKDTYETYKIEKCINFHTKIGNKIFVEKFNNILEKTISLDEIRDMLNFIPPWIEVEFFENMKSIKSLSSGQKGLFSFLINIVYQLDNIKYKHYQSVNLFLDETDVGFHPEWQRLYFQEVLNTIKNNWNKKINLIFLTHSPFILSDLPKNNILFLDNGQQVETDIETFGANIHTLFSSGFFMKNGLMGEFAKKKIDKAIKYLNQSKLTEKEITYCETIISIMGEPLLKRQLQKMLDSKRLTKIDAINQQIISMEYELEILKKYQQKFVHEQLNDRAKRKYSKKKKDD